MTADDLDVLVTLSRLENNQSCRSPWIAKQLGLPRTREGSRLLRNRLGRLKRQGLVTDFKTDPFSEYKFWRISHKGRYLVQNNGNTPA